MIRTAHVKLISLTSDAAELISYTATRNTTCAYNRSKDRKPSFYNLEHYLVVQCTTHDTFHTTPHKNTQCTTHVAPYPLHETTANTQLMNMGSDTLLKPPRTTPKQTYYNLLVDPKTLKSPKFEL